MPDAGTWSGIARQVIACVHTALPDDATLKQRKAALKDAYPFGDRSYWPYRAWCRERRKYLAKFITAKDAEAKRSAWRDRMRGQGYMFAEDVSA